MCKLALVFAFHACASSLSRANDVQTSEPLQSLTQMLLNANAVSGFHGAFSPARSASARFGPILAQTKLAERPPSGEEVVLKPILDDRDPEKYKSAKYNNPGGIRFCESWVPVIDFDAKTVKEVCVSLRYADKAPYVVQRAVKTELANKRGYSTAKAKGRGEVSGGGAKPYQQKGTGRARRGSSRSPLIVGGGKSHGPRPRDYSLKMNKKEKKLAFATTLQNSMPRARIIPNLDDTHFTMPPSTKKMQEFINRLEIPEEDLQFDGQLLMILGECNYATWLSARNIPYLKLVVLGGSKFPPVHALLKARNILISEDAMSLIQERYGDMYREGYEGSLPKVGMNREDWSEFMRARREAQGVPQPAFEAAR